MPFYKALGWQTDGDEFIEAGIPHHRMSIKTPDTDADADQA